jgi:hypothetical protein
MSAGKQRPQPPLSLKVRFEIGASLIPPVALLYLASRAGWIPTPSKTWLAAIPVALLVGMLLPHLFLTWHRLFSAGQRSLGYRLLKMLFAIVFLLTVMPIALWLRLRGRSFLEPHSHKSYWSPAKQTGSMKDQY